MHKEKEGEEEGRERRGVRKEEEYWNKIWVKWSFS